MKITRLRTELVHVPLPTPIPSSLGLIEAAGCILVFLETDAGLVGEGLCFTVNGRRSDVLLSTIRSYEPLVIGLDPEFGGAFWQAAWNGLSFFGHRGIAILGLAPLDMAILDLRAKKAGINVARLLGACRQSVPVYASGGLRLSATIDGLQSEAAAVLGRGFRALKMSLGKPTIAEDVARVRAVREAIGSGVTLMADANQQLDAARTIRLGHAIEEFELAWIEEPVPYYDHVAEAEIAAALVTPIASGENEYTRLGMLDMLKLRSADILMPDLQRMGGPTEFMKVAHLAEAFGVPISSHLFTEMSLPLMAAIPNGKFLEHMPWFSPLYSERVELDDKGQAIVPDRPGWGFAFDPAAIARFRA
jgi:L-alanine-DL-glutamate epimerase-like enolase superfamily enzyme